MCYICEAQGPRWPPIQSGPESHPRRHQGVGQEEAGHGGGVNVVTTTPKGGKEGGNMRDFCPYCDAILRRSWAGDESLEVCEDHGVLEGLSDTGWREILTDRGIDPDTEE